MADHDLESTGVDRRSLLIKGTAAAGAAVWVAPSVIGVVQASAEVSAAPDGFRFALDGGQEVPSNPSPASGTAIVRIVGDQICIEMTATDLTAPVIACHIHEAPAGANGGVVLNIGPPDSTEPSTWDRCFVEPTLAAEILAAPENYYVNVHTSTYPGGEIRGQLA